MKRCDLFHGTARSLLPLIARDGLLTREQLENRGQVITYPGYTRAGIVYATDDEADARHWGVASALEHRRGRGGNWWEFDDTKVSAVLCLDSSPARFDRNLHREDGGSLPGNYGTRSTCYEIDGPVPPDRIRVHNAGRCVPISEYVQEVA